MRNPFAVLLVSLVFTASLSLSHPARAGSTDVIINEIHYHPLSDCEEEEFIELYNRGSDAVDLGGWSFIEGVPFSFPAETSLGAREYLVVARDPAALEARFGEIERLYGPWGAWGGGEHQASLSNDGEDIVLADASRAEVNRVEYNDKTPWPVSPDGGGPSLELVCPDLPNDQPGNWRAAGVLGNRWSFFQASGKAYGSTFLVRLTQPGVWYIDDVSLRPEGGGENLVQNGGFEADGGWTFEGNHAGSARVTGGAHGGQGCLRVVSSGRGDAANAVRQTIAGPALAGARCTISFWARRVQAGPGLVAGLPGGAASFETGESIPMWGKEGGSSSFDPASGIYTIAGFSFDPEPRFDELYFLHGQLSGDGGLEATVTWIYAQGVWARAGLMLRESSAEDSKCAMVVLNRASGTWMQVRAATGGELQDIQGPATPGPVKLRLERQGNTFIASADAGGGLEEIGRADIPMASTVLAGLMVSSDIPDMATATFESVSANVFPLEASTPAEDAPVSVATPGMPNTRLAARAPPWIRKVEHIPQSPKSADAVTVRAKVDCLDSTPVTSALVEYQVVTPGHYIRLFDADYEQDWTPVTMHDDGSNGDEEAGDAVWTAILPAQPNRTLVRYRIVATDSEGAVARLPFPEDPTPNFAWSVYAGIPDYVADRQSHQGAVPYAHPADALSKLPVYQLLTDAEDFQACWNNDAADAASGTVWAGTFVAGGKVYDHIHYRLRGSVTRGLEKKSFKIKFNHGSRFERIDDFGRPDPVKRTDLDLNSAFQFPGHEDPIEPGVPTGARGECGIYDTLAYSLFRWMGVPAPGTDWVQLRVVKGESEAGADQYTGDFFGIYLDLENPDSRFLESHDLPEGNLYKIDVTWTKEANGCDPADDSDIREFTSTLPIQTGHGPEDPPAVSLEWLEGNVDLGEYYSYHSVVEMTALQDIGNHNCFFFHHPESNRWMMVPWDVHLSFTWGTPGQSGDNDLWKKPIIDTHEACAVAYKNRLREGLDLLYTESKLFPIIDGWAAMIAPLAAADRDRWDDGTLTSPYGPLDQRVADLKSWIQAHIPVVADFCADSTVPSTPAITSPATGSMLAADSLAFTSTPFSGSAGRAHAATRWVATRVSQPSGAPLPLEVLLAENELAPGWDSGLLAGSVTAVTVPPGSIDPEVGAAYQVRVRYLDDAGRWSHWSAPVDVEIGPTGPVQFIRGDADGNGDINITDPITTLSYLFLGGADLPCRKAGDANDDGAINLTDAIYVLSHLFLGGAHPLAPFPACGDDPTADALPCASTACR